MIKKMITKSSKSIWLFLSVLTVFFIFFSACDMDTTEPKRNKKTDSGSDFRYALISITDDGDAVWHVQFSQDVPGLQIGVEYTITFDAYANRNVTIMCDVNQAGGTYQQVLAMAGVSPLFNITTTKTTFSRSAISTIADEGDGKSELQFNLGNIGLYDIYIDNVSVTADNVEQIINGDFSAPITTGWNDLYLEGTAEATVTLIESSTEPDFGDSTVTEIDTVTDIDGNTYQTVQIGDQLWMAENLKVTHYRNGDAIPNVTDDTEWYNLSTGAYCAYDYNESNADTYGYLYNWEAIDDNRDIAPTGWHVPTETEWQTLIDYLGGESVAGGKLKEAGTLHWASPNDSATNESGFTALPGGRAPVSGFEFLRIYVSASFWSSTEIDDETAWGYSLFHTTHPYLSEITGGAISPWDDEKYLGFSVRCIKD